jgi:hypothetical protein
MNQQKTEQYSEEQYQARMKLLRVKWNAKLRRILLYILLGFLGFILVLGVVSLFSYEVAQLVGAIILGLSILVSIAAACNGEFDWLKPLRATPSDPVATLKRYYNSLSTNFGKKILEMRK